MKSRKTFARIARGLETQNRDYPSTTAARGPLHLVRLRGGIVLCKLDTHQSR